MTRKPLQTPNWKSIGSSRTSPPADTRRMRVELDVFYLVIGFEVNSADAFKNNTHDLAIDYGHAFYYLVKNLVIAQSFSFGPYELGKIGWFNKGAPEGKEIYSIGAITKDGHKNSRPGTADHKIREKVKAFKIPLNRRQAETPNNKTTEARIEIYNRTLTYSAIVNDTCAETAKEILDDSGIDTPSGSSWVKHSNIAEIPLAFAVNPYKWHRNFKTKYEEVIFYPDGLSEWIPTVGELDPIYGVTSLKNPGR